MTKILALFLLAALAAPALAEDDKPDKVAEPAKSWTLTFEPAAWYASPSKNIRLPQSTPGPAPAMIGFPEMNLDGTRISPMGELHLRGEILGLTIRGAHLDTGQKGWTAAGPGTLGDMPFVGGNPMRASLQFTSVEVEGTCRLFQNALGKLASGGHRNKPQIDAIFGGRLMNVDFDASRLTPIQARVSAQETFVQPIGGVRLSLDLYGQALIDVETTFGWWPGERESFTWDIIAGFQWKPLTNLGVQIGYRQLLFQTRTNSTATGFQYDGALAGLYFGVVVTF